MVVLITGDPGSGKTTVCMRVVELIKRKHSDLKICGFITREIRESGRRSGFEMVDLMSGERGLLAHVMFRSSVRVGKYAVNVPGIERMVERVESQLESCDLIVIDEVGPMELKSERFRKLIYRVLDFDSVILTIHKRSKDHLLIELRKKFHPVEITVENRDSMPHKIADMVMRWK